MRASFMSVVHGSTPTHPALAVASAALEDQRFIVARPSSEPGHPPDPRAPRAGADRVARVMTGPPPSTWPRGFTGNVLGRHIVSRQLVIEVNPSSNLLIADLDHPLDQPMFHLRPINPNERRGLPVCISADDPLTFATCFEDEVAYAWAGMVGSGQVPAA